MTATEIASDGLVPDDTAGPAPGSDALHAVSLPVAGVLRKPVTNGADVLPVRPATGSLSASHPSVVDLSTGQRVAGQQGEPGAAGAPPLPFSRKSEAPSTAMPGASTPTDSDSTREV